MVWAAFFKFIAYLVFGLHVADTIATGIVRTDLVTLPVIVSGLPAAVAWNLVTRYSFRFIAYFDWRISGVYHTNFLLLKE